MRTMKTTTSHSSHVPLKCRKRSIGSILILELGGTIVRSWVVIVSMEDCDGDALGVTTEGDNVQLIVAGATQFSVTGWANPLGEVTLIA